MFAEAVHKGENSFLWLSIQYECMIIDLQWPLTLYCSTSRLLELDVGSLGNSWSTPAATHLSIVKRLTATKTSDAATSMSGEDIAANSEPHGE